MVTLEENDNFSNILLEIIDHKLKLMGINVDDPPTDKVNLIINHLPCDMYEDEFYLLFAKYGSIASYKLVRDAVTYQSIGYGYVQYKEHDNAVQAQMLLHNHEIRGNCLKVGFYNPYRMDTKINVGGIPFDMSTHHFETFFKRFGKMNDIHFRAKGVGFLFYEDLISAERAWLAMEINSPIPIPYGKYIAIKIAHCRLNKPKIVDKIEDESPESVIPDEKQQNEPIYYENELINFFTILLLIVFSIILYYISG